MRDGFASRPALRAEALAILDDLRKRLALDRSNHFYVEAIETMGARLQAIIVELSDLPLEANTRPESAQPDAAMPVGSLRDAMLALKERLAARPRPLWIKVRPPPIYDDVFEQGVCMLDEARRRRARSRRDVSRAYE